MELEVQKINHVDLPHWPTRKLLGSKVTLHCNPIDNRNIAKVTFFTLHHYFMFGVFMVKFVEVLQKNSLEYQRVSMF